MADCTDYPTPEDAKRFKNNANSVNEFVTSDSDTFVDQDGGEHITIEGIETLAENQRDQFDATFQAQFTYAKIGNISDFVGDTLAEAEKLNSYQYPDDSGNWYGPIQSQTFPIAIPADPTVSGSGWSLVNGLAQDNVGIGKVVATGSTTPRRLDDRFADTIQSYSSLLDLTSRSLEVADGFTVYLEGFDSEGDGLSGIYDISSIVSGGSISIGNGLYVNPLASQSKTTIKPEVITKMATTAMGARRKQILITGDSLSFNGFDYHASWNVVGSGYARDQPVGLSSWAHLIRDMIITGTSFQSIKELTFSSIGLSVAPPSVSERKNTAINGNLLTFSSIPSTTGSLTIPNEYAGSSSLLVQAQPVGSGHSIDVNGVTHSLDGDGSYKGYGFLLIPFTGDLVHITNVTDSVSVYGIVASDLKIPVISGKGGWSSTQILAEYNTLVAPYNPDIILYIIGANDGWPDPYASGYWASVQAFIDRAKGDNPNVEIVLISMPPTSSYPDKHIKDYVFAAQRLATINNCSSIDLHTELLSYHVDDWRYDNIHCNKHGDTIWFNIFKKLLFPSVDVCGFKPIREYWDNTEIADYNKELRGFAVTVSLTATTPSVIDCTTGEANKRQAQSGLSYGAIDGVPDALLIYPPTGYRVSKVEGIEDFSATIVARYRESPQVDGFGTPSSAVVAGRANGSIEVAEGSGKYLYITYIRDLD